MLGGETLRRLARDDLAAAGAVVEIVEDHPRIVERGAVLDDHRRYLAERVLLAQAVLRVAGIGGFDPHVAVEAEEQQRDAHLAGERGRRRGTQDHHRGITLDRSSTLKAEETNRQHLTPAAKAAAGHPFHAALARDAAAVLAGDDQIDGFRTLALLVRLDVEADALPLDQRLQSRALDSGDMHENISPTVVRFDKPITTLAVEEFDRTGHCHRETPSPRLLRRRPRRRDG